MKKNKLKEADFIVNSPNDAQTLAGTNKLTKDDNVYIDKTAKPPIEEEEGLEPEAIIEPQDKSTIKYLSNILDDNGEPSPTFSISDKRYQLVNGLDSEDQKVMAVFCLDDLNENGDNLIHSVDYFDKTIATPMKEKLEMESAHMQGSNIQSTPDIQEVKNDSYEDCKHFLVNRKTNEVRKFKSIKEMLTTNKLDEEDYMGVSEFKKHMNEKLFGSKKRKVETLNEITPNGEETDEEMNLKAKKLMELIAKRIPSNVIDTIATPVAKREVIAAFAELIGVPRNGLSSLINGLKVLAKEPVPVSESKVITKNQLMESLKPNKIVKVKDIK